MWFSNNLFISLTLLLGSLYVNVEGAEIWLFGSNSNSYTVYSLNHPEPLLDSPSYKADRQTGFVVHGFGGSADDTCVKPIVDALINNGDTNVCALDWREEASNKLGPEEYPIAAKNTVLVGKGFGEALDSLYKNGLPVNNIKLIGFSLGAHVCGNAGREFYKETNQELPSITGLDPAGPGFEKPLGLPALDTTCAVKVRAIHTNPGRLGSDQNEATMDIDANCGNPTQPGCTGGLSVVINSPQNNCSHFRSCAYFAEALNIPDAFIASYAQSCPDWKANGGSGKISIGEEISDGAQGTYYFQTNAAAPYGRGDAGSRYQN